MAEADRHGRKRLVQMIRQDTDDGRSLVDFLLHVFRGEPIDGRRPTIRQRMDAAIALSEIGWGRPVQPIKVVGTKPLAFALAPSLAALWN